MRSPTIKPQTLPPPSLPIPIDNSSWGNAPTAVPQTQQSLAPTAWPQSPPPAKPPTLDRSVRTSYGRDPVWAYFFCRRLIADPRFNELVASHRQILLVGVLVFADADGVFWPKRATWAAAAAEHPETVKRAARAAEQVGILQRQPHGRPNGRQGSNTYLFDAALVRLAHDDASEGIYDLP
jgi:hypothetical protein